MELFTLRPITGAHKCPQKCLQITPNTASFSFSSDSKEFVRPETKPCCQPDAATELSIFALWSFHLSRPPSSWDFYLFPLSAFGTNPTKLCNLTSLTACSPPQFGRHNRSSDKLIYPLPSQPKRHNCQSKLRTLVLMVFWIIGKNVTLRTQREVKAQKVSGQTRRLLLRKEKPADFS